MHQNLCPNCFLSKRSRLCVFEVVKYLCFKPVLNRASIINTIRMTKNAIHSFEANIYFTVFSLFQGVTIACHDKTTPWNITSDGHIAYLDRHDVACDNHQYITRFRLNWDGKGHARYLYTCCSVT